VLDETEAGISFYDLEDIFLGNVVTQAWVTATDSNQATKLHLAFGSITLGTNTVAVVPGTQIYDFLGNPITRTYRAELTGPLPTVGGILEISDVQ